MKIRVNIIKYLANLKFAIVLLIGIASLSILGTVIEQDQTIEIEQLRSDIIEPRSMGERKKDNHTQIPKFR